LSGFASGVRSVIRAFSYRLAEHQDYRIWLTAKVPRTQAAVLNQLAGIRSGSFMPSMIA
jgi:hypothetical protein